MRFARVAAVMAIAVFVPVVSFLHAQSSEAPATAAGIKQQFIGNWKLVSYDAFDAGGNRSPGSLNEGRIMYDANGNMACQLMWRGKPAHRHTGYYGKYEINAAKGTVTHLVEGAWQESWLGTAQVRYFQFSPDGKRLMLSTKTDGRVTGTLEWERVG